MNQNWKNFLLSKQAHFATETDIKFPNALVKLDKVICPIPYLAILKVSGKDAAKLLQGQITCNVNDINETKSSIGAICNPKGRVITTFLLIKSNDDFLMILSKELIDSIQKRLQMFILRSDVKLENITEDLCIFGLNDSTSIIDAERFSTTQDTFISVNISKSQQLVIASTDLAISLWTHYNTEAQFTATNSSYWRYLDLIAEIPWITPETTEEFIPQMLNLDELGGISYTKGCYTGQEIVARTHYLGKTKRELVLAECLSTYTPAPNANIYTLDSDTDQGIAKVLYGIPTPNQENNVLIKQSLLIVLQITENTPYNLIIKAEPPIPVTLLTEQP